jgi:hypothetical protein
MGLTKRQEEMIAEIIVEESRGAAASQQERHRILAEVDEPGEVITESKPVDLGPGLKGAIQDLVETFVAGAPLYEGREFDGGAGLDAATKYLRRLIENDVREVRQMLVDGDFGDEG